MIRSVGNVKATHVRRIRVATISNRWNYVRVDRPIGLRVGTWVAGRARETWVQAVRDHAQDGGDRESNQRAAVAMTGLVHEYQTRRYYPRPHFAERQVTYLKGRLTRLSEL